MILSVLNNGLSKDTSIEDKSTISNQNLLHFSPLRRGHVKGNVHQFFFISYFSYIQYQQCFSVLISLSVSLQASNKHIKEKNQPVECFICFTDGESGHHLPILKLQALPKLGGFSYHFLYDATVNNNQ